MVIRDSHDFILKRATPEQVQAQLSRLPMAAPLDRLAASLIDHAIILWPILYLVVAPFQRAAKEAALFDSSIQLTLATLLGGVAAIVVIIGYQTFCVWNWGRTPGQLFMGLKVRSIWSDQKLSLTQAFVRSLYWAVSLLLLGVPFLAVYSNLMRRTFHDRVTDTVVVAQKVERSVGRPSLQESALVRAVYWAVSAVAIFSVTSILLGQLFALEKQSDLIQSLEDEDQLCAAITEAQGEWPQRQNQETERLDVAMSLYAAGSIDLECLSAEVKNLFSEDEASPLLSLAKSFVYASHQELSDRYLDEVCSLNSKSEECTMSQLVGAVSEHNQDQIEQRLSSINEGSPIYMLVWAARHYIRSENYHEAKRMIDKIPDMKSLGDFIVAVRAKSFWGVGQKEAAQGVVAAAYSALSDDTQFEISSFMCFEDIWADCGQLSGRNCSKFNQLFRQIDASGGNIKTSLAFLRSQECTQGSAIQGEELLSLPVHDDVKAMMLALQSKNDEDIYDFLNEPDIDYELKNEAMRRLAIQSRQKNELKKIFDIWKNGARTLSWRRLGETLGGRYQVLRMDTHHLAVQKQLGVDQAQPEREVRTPASASSRKSQSEKGDL